MRQGINRLWAFVLSLTLLISTFALCLPLSANAAQASSTRFIFSALEGERGTRYDVSEENELSLVLSANESSFSALSPAPLGNNGATNTLLVSLVNRSNATALRVSYQYTDYQQVTETVEQTLIADSDEVQTFYLKSPHIASGITSLTVSFLSDSAPSGTVILSSFCDISMYTAQGGQGSSTDPWTTEFSCQYDTVTGNICISGQLNHVALARYGGEVLALFALDPTEEIYLSNKTPVARIDLSSNFSFTVAASSARTLFSRYVVAAVTARGERVPLSSPIYPAISISQIPGDVGFKGFHTDSVSTTLNVGAGIEIVDVYLDRLHGNQNTGILYVGDESYYYFDENYVSELDSRIRRLTGAGCTVYLRFLVSPNAASDLPYLAFTPVDESVVNKGIVIEDSEALNSVYALTDFLTSRYANATIGKISGIILGRRVDHAAVYNHVGSMDLSTYAGLYASLVQLVAGTARRNVGSVDIVVPLSDRIFTGEMSTDDLSGNYYPALFLQSLLRALKDSTQNPPSFSLLLESNVTPAQLVGQSHTHYGVEGLPAFQTLLRQYVAQYPFLSATTLYCWEPDVSLSAEKAIAAYVWQYIKLYFDGQTKAFITDLSMMKRDEAQRFAEVLSYIVQRIDTAASESVTKPALALLGVDTLTDIAQNYTLEAMVDQSLVQKSLSTDGYGKEVDLKGSYAYWNFDTAIGSLGWYSGSLCNDLSVLSDKKGRALTAQCISGTSGEYAEFACHFPSRKDISFAPYIKLKLGINGVAGASYEIQVRLAGKGITMIASAVVRAGETNEIYLDLSDCATDLSGMNAIRILSRPLDGIDDPYTVHLHRVTFESETLTDSELASRMAVSSDAADGNDGQKDSGDHAVAIIVTMIVIAVSFTLVAVFAVRQKRKVSVSRDKRADKSEKG